MALVQTLGPPGGSDAKQIFDLPPFKWKTAEKIIEIIMDVMNIQSSGESGYFSSYLFLSRGFGDRRSKKNRKIENRSYTKVHKQKSFFLSEKI